jgi:acyl carrier protein
MNVDDVVERLKRILADQTGHPATAHAIHSQTPLYGRGLGLSSLDIVSLIVQIEDEYNVFFEANEIGPSIATFGTLVRAIHGKLPTNGSSPAADGH